MSFLPPSHEQLRSAGSDLHLLRHLRTGEDQSACALLMKLCPSGGPSWFPGTQQCQPKPGSSRQAADACPSSSPFAPPPSPRGATRGWRGFPPTSAAALAKQGTAEPPALASLESESSAPAPALVGRWGLERCWGVFQDTAIRTQLLV